MAFPVLSLSARSAGVAARGTGVLLDNRRGVGDKVQPIMIMDENDTYRCRICLQLKAFQPDTALYKQLTTHIHHAEAIFHVKTQLCSLIPRPVSHDIVFIVAVYWRRYQLAFPSVQYIIWSVV